MSEKAKSNKSVSVPFAVWELLCRVSMHAAPEVGRRLSLSEVITAAMYVAHQHHPEMLPALADKGTLTKLSDALALHTEG